MDINASPINPYLQPTQIRRDSIEPYGRRDTVEPSTRAEERNQASATPTRDNENSTDYRQMIRQARMEQARGQQGSSYTMNEPYPVQRALGAYQQQLDEGRRYLDGAELMPRVDAYV